MLSACFAFNSKADGFNLCDDISACRAQNCLNTGAYGFDTCDRMAACYANNNTNGVNNCSNGAAINSSGNSTSQYSGTNVAFDSASNMFSVN